MTTPLPGMPKPEKQPCKDCRIEYPNKPRSQWREAPHPGPRCVTHHRKAKKDQKERAHRQSVMKTYGFPDVDGYDRLYRFQRGVCAICQRATGKTKRLAVDHNHRTDEIRGLLCSTCNQYLGYLRDNPEAYARGVAYLNDPPFRQLMRDYARELLDE